MRADGKIVARATVHLQGLAVGAEALVDPADAYIAGLLESRLLVAVEEEEIGGNPDAVQEWAES